MGQEEQWIRQATEDLTSAEYNLQGKRLDVAALCAHKSAELALKAVLIHQTGKLLKIHDLLRLATEVKAPDAIQTSCKLLNPIYIETKYPFSLEKKIPFERFSIKDVKELIAAGKEVLRWASQNLN